MAHSKSLEDLLSARERIRGHLRQDEIELAELTQRQSGHVLTARRLGMKWIEIGDALGVPRSTVESRFGAYVRQNMRPRKPWRRVLPF